MIRRGEKIEKLEFVDSGYVDGVMMTSEKAHFYYKMVENHLNDLIDGKFANKLNYPNVKGYIEGLEKKIKDGKKVALKYENTNQINK